MLTIKNTLAALLCFVAIFVLGQAHAETKTKTSTLQLNKETVAVYWSDGDSFKILPKTGKAIKTRISHFNALESYGPVHRWGQWTALELSQIASQATSHVRAGTWNCIRISEKDGTTKKDSYGRILVDCPDLTLSLISEGLAHLFFFEDTAKNEPLVAAQHKAQAEKKGMWAKGIPDVVVTSLHSIDEKSNKGPTAYNRIVDTKTGITEIRKHSNKIAQCEEVCIQESCMTYVPYTKRYGKNKAPCLNTK
jgi:micrococcal nuclease